MSDYDFIRQFSAINIKNICIDLGLEKDYTNIMSGTTKKWKLAKVRKEIQKRLKRINENG